MKGVKGIVRKNHSLRFTDEGWQALSEQASKSGRSRAQFIEYVLVNLALKELWEEKTK